MTLGRECDSEKYPVGPRRHIEHKLDITLMLRLDLGKDHLVSLGPMGCT